MALSETTRLYEILLRAGPTGAIAGMHRQNITEVLRDGVVILGQPGDAVALDWAGFKAALTVQDRAALAAALI